MTSGDQQRYRPAVLRLLQTVWLWPALIMLVVGGYRLGTPDLWRDEVASWTAATRPLGDLLRMLQHVDASNGTYYVLLHGWTAVFGDSVISLRLPSVLAMAGAAGFVALTAERLFGGRVAGMSAGALFAVVPLVSRYAQEARSYALVTCAVAAATWFLLRALDEPTLRRWAPYCVAMAVAGAGHLVSLSTLVGQLALVTPYLVRRGAARRRLLWRLPLAVAVAALAALPVAVLGNRQSGRQLGWLARPSLDQLWHFGEPLFGSARVFHVFVVLGLLALALPGRRRPAVQLLLLAVLPVLAVWVMSRGSTSYFLDRYLLFTVPAWAALAGGGIRAVYGAVVAVARRTRTPRELRVAGLLLALGLVATAGVVALPRQSLVRYQGSHSQSKEPYQAAAGLIAAGYRPGDGLVVPLGDQAWSMVGPGVSYYLPDRVQPYPVFVERSAAQAEDLFPVACPRPADCTGPGRRAWLLVLGDTADPLAVLPGDQVAALRERYGPPDRVTPLGGVTLALLDGTR
ncbi:glycosyltransferase family 39 protein [Kitasatospora sp. NPDC058201]|uniref:glycosyltransferase family 39 protein n=1 Tax=Streptomycetaceae TaxID=2062 RepID=UPI002E7A98A8|nr:glycosyltransferase family 39 protein [Streptomyces sp. BE303]MED7955457.1 glycosyltransferase family 39 protein [Streptomyces sp. BE303]